MRRVDPRSSLTRRRLYKSRSSSGKLFQLPMASHIKEKKSYTSSPSLFVFHNRPIHIFLSSLWIVIINNNAEKTSPRPTNTQKLLRFTRRTELLVVGDKRCHKRDNCSLLLQKLGQRWQKSTALLCNCTHKELTEVLQIYYLNVFREDLRRFSGINPSERGIKTELVNI